MNFEFRISDFEFSAIEANRRPVAAMDSKPRNSKFEIRNSKFL